MSVDPNDRWYNHSLAKLSSVAMEQITASAPRPRGRVCRMRADRYAITPVRALDYAAVDRAGGRHGCGLYRYLAQVCVPENDADLTTRSDRMIASQIGFLAELSPERGLEAIDEDI
jgi:hypothetical protein